ncbi:MAG: hypothetical protein ABH808_03655 [Candidatus Kuenenbacteria bacterium]
MKKIILLLLSVLLYSSMSIAGGIDPSVMKKFLPKTIGQAAIERQTQKPPPPPPPVILVKIDLLLGTTNLTIGSTTTANVVAKYSDNSEKDVTGSATLISSEPGIATISVAGKITAMSTGTTVITASFGGFVSERTVMVIAPPPPPPPPAPVITGVTPGTATNAGIATLTISGNNFFQEGLRVFLYREAVQQFLQGEIISASTTTVEATFNLKDQALGKRSMIVVNPDSQHGTLTDGFVVVAQPLQYGEIQFSTIPGSCTWQLDRNTFPATSGTTRAGTTTLQVEVGYDYSLLVITPWNDTMAKNFVVEEGQTVEFQFIFPPKIMTISPTVVTATVATITITGYNFWPGATVQLAGPNEADLIGEIIALEEGTITATFDLRDAATGTYILIVENPDGQDDGFDGLEVVDPDIPPPPVLPPVITGVFPGTATNAGSVTLKISGDNFFQEGLQVSLLREATQQFIPGQVISAATATVVATFDLRNFSLGKMSIIVENPDSQRGTLTDGIEIVASPVATIKILCNKEGSFIFWGPIYIGKISGGELSFFVTPPEKNWLEVYSPDFQQHYLEEIAVEYPGLIVKTVTF